MTATALWLCNILTRRQDQSGLSDDQLAAGAGPSGGVRSEAGAAPGPDDPARRGCRAVRRPQQRLQQQQLHRLQRHREHGQQRDGRQLQQPAAAAYADIWRRPRTPHHRWRHRRPPPTGRRRTETDQRRRDTVSTSTATQSSVRALRFRRFPLHMCA